MASPTPLTTAAAPLGPLPPEHPPVPAPRLGVLLVNLGTPEAPTARAVRTYLAEFLSDRRVVDYPRAFWMPLLHGVILNTRPRKTAALYASIWDRAENASPLRVHTLAQTAAVAAALGPSVRVDMAMRYGEPSLARQIAAMTAAGARRLLIVPLYPQYSATTTGSVVDAVGKVLGEMSWQPTVRTAPPFHDAPGYISALAASARTHMPPGTERVILSFHGIPKRYFAAGDPYHCHCQKTARLLRAAMGWSEDFAPIGFQSKFGPEAWLGPATADLVEAAAKEGIRNIAVMAPAFVADCIETLEEIGIGLGEAFEAAGGTHLTAIPCLNADAAFTSFLTEFVQRELQGWI